MRPRGHSIFVITTALLLLPGPSLPARAQTAPPEDLATLRREVFDLRLGLIRADGLRDEIAAEEALLDRKDAGRGAGPAPSVARDGLWEKLLAAPEFQDGKTRKALESFLENARQEQKAAADGWREAEARAWAFRDQVPEKEARLGRKWDSDAAGGGSIDDPTRWLLALGGLTLAASLALVLHETRDYWRWRLRSLGSRPTLILFALGLGLAASGCSAGGPTGSGPKDERHALTEQRAELQRQLAERTQANRAAEEKLAGRQADLRRTGGGWLPTPSNPVQDGLATRLRRAEEEEQRLFRDIRATSRATAAGHGRGAPNRRGPEAGSRAVRCVRRRGELRGAAGGGPPHGGRRRDPARGAAAAAARPGSASSPPQGRERPVPALPGHRLADRHHERRAGRALPRGAPR